MTNPFDLFQLLLDRVRQGIPAAAVELYQTFSPRLLGVIRRLLHPFKALRRLLDPDDLAQDVWFTFFSKSLRTKRFDSPEKLAVYLAKIGRSNVRAMVWRYLRASKRKLALDRPVEVLDGAAPGVECLMLQAAPDRTAAEQEEYDDFLQKQRVADRPVLALLLQGYSAVEAAEKLGQTESTVRRIQGRAASAHFNRPRNQRAGTR